MESREQVEKTAAAWIHQRDCGEWTAADQARLDAWMKASAAHCTVFLRLDSVWREAARLKALGAGVEPGVIPSREELSFSTPFDPAVNKPEVNRRRNAVAWGMAATVLLAVAVATARFLFSEDTSYRTNIGGLEGVSMVDGSHVILNTDSEIKIAMTGAERRVHLLRGEAFFEVAKDPKRPFVVIAGEQRIVAVGTKFSVRRDAQDAQVVVSEGRVRVESSSGNAMTPPPAEFGAGSIVRSGGAGVLVQNKASNDVEHYLSWRTGFLTFLDMPLAQAAAEFNRYNEQQILIEDAHLASLRIDGNFRATNVNAFVRLLEGGFPVEIERRQGWIVVKARR